MTNFIIAKKRLCFAALIEIILKQFGYNKFDQIYLAGHFGITLPQNDPLSNKIKNVRYSDDPYDWGMNISTTQMEVFLKENGIILDFKYKHANEFEDWSFENFIKHNLVNNNLICTVDYNTLFNAEETKSFGHAVLINKFRNGKTEVYDPGPEDYGTKEVDPYNLFVASKRMNGGVWTFTQ